MAGFRYCDHPQNRIALMRAHLSGDITQVAQAARERDIPIDITAMKYLRETLGDGGASGIFAPVHDRKIGRTPEATLDEWQVQIEAQIPETTTRTSRRAWHRISRA